MQQTINVGQVQPSALSKVKAAVESIESFITGIRQFHYGNLTDSLRQTLRNAVVRVEAASAESDLCQVLGITPWHFSAQGLAVTALVGMVIIMICGLAEWLEGGAL